MKKNLLSIVLTIALFAPIVAQAQDAVPRILTVSAVNFPTDNGNVPGAFINWTVDGEDPAAAAFRIFQVVDGDPIEIEETDDLTVQTLIFEESLVTDGPQTYAIAIINAEGNILSTSDTHSTAFLTLDSGDCDEPILVSWTPYDGLDITEQRIFVGQGEFDPQAETFTLDATDDSFEYTPTDIDAQTELFISLASISGISQLSSNSVSTVTCGSVGIEDLEAFIAIGPNPTSKNFSVTLNTVEEEALTLSAFSADGRMVYNAPFSQQATIAVSDWTKGVYIYKLSDDQGSVITGKFVKN